MKFSTAWLLLWLLLSLPPVCLASEDASFEPVQIGDLEIYPIRDASMDLESTLIPELARYPEYSQLFKNGRLPGVTQTWYLKDGSHNILIDAGWGNELRLKGNTLDILKTNGISPDTITDVLLTHLDSDHIGGLVENGKPVFPNSTLWISEPEAAAWKNGNIKNRNEASLIRAKALWEAYPNRIKLFNYDQEILPGIIALDASGHTPGHTAYEITSGNDKIIIAGDLIHLYQIQLQKPEINSVYDMDSEKASLARKNILNRASEEKAVLGGMHLPLISPVLKRDDGGFLMREPR